MGEFLYFIPAQTAAGPALLAELGIAAVLGGTDVEQGLCQSGPAGGSGVLFRRSAAAGPPVSYAPDRQSWFPAGPQKVYWLGFEHADPPCPADLARGLSRRIPGSDVELADGNLWHCPIARLAAGGTNLPIRLGLDPQTGADSFRVADSAVKLWEMAGEVWARDVAAAQAQAAGDDGIDDPLSADRVIEIAVAALAANYRVGRWEVQALELLGQAELREVLDVLVDIPGLKELAGDGGGKKNATPSGT